MRLIRAAVVQLAVALVLLAATTPPAEAAAKKKLGEGDGVFRPAAVESLAKVTFAGVLSPAERAYLGVAAEGPFTLADVKADLVLVEFFNTSCYACALQAPVMDELFAKIQEREGLKAHVRIVGIGAGNVPEQIEEYRGHYEIPFPLIPDPDFAAYDTLGNNEGTPYILLWSRQPAATGASAARAQVGFIPDADVIVREIESVLAGVPLPGDIAPMAASADWRKLRPALPEAELATRLKAAAAAAGLADATVTAVPVSAEETFYRLEGGGRHLWGMVAGRSKVCNVCHDIFFILLFDDSGKVREFAPIAITKYKNVEFDERDTAFLRGRVVGRYLTQEISFDPKVDAVSTATMSSALVFDTMRRLRESYAGMVKAGLARP